VFEKKGLIRPWTTTIGHLKDYLFDCDKLEIKEGRFFHGYVVVVVSSMLCKHGGAKRLQGRIILICLACIYLFRMCEVLA